MSFDPIANSASTQERDEFKRLYRRSTDPTEFVSQADLRRMEELKQKYPEEVQRINSVTQGLQRSESSTARGLNTSASINLNLQRQKGDMNLPEGEGFYRISPDLVYKGAMKDGLPNGNGDIIYISTQSIIYQGSVKDGQYQGQGCLYRDGYLYEKGEFINGHIKEGIRYNSNGTIYSGSFEKDLFDGEGRVVFTNGFFYKAKFKAGVIDSPNVEIAYPSARNATSVPSTHITITEDSLMYSIGGNFLVFYTNGDIFFGHMEASIPREGYLHRFVKNTFVTMKVGSAKGVSATPPSITVLEGGKYKTFSMMPM